MLTAVLVVQVTVLLQAPDCFVTRATADVLDHRVRLQTVARQMLWRVHVVQLRVPPVQAFIAVLRLTNVLQFQCVLQPMED